MVINSGLYKPRESKKFVSLPETTKNNIQDKRETEQLNDKSLDQYLKCKSLTNQVFPKRISFKSLKIGSEDYKKLPLFPENSKLAKLEKIYLKKFENDKFNKLDARKGYVEQTPKEAFNNDLLETFLAIKDIAKQKEINFSTKIPSPLEKESDSSWMQNANMYNLTPRAIGGVLNSIKLLPTVRQESILLSPIFETHGSLYAIDSFEVNSEIVKKDLEEINSGLSKEEKMTPEELYQALFEAAHLLDKKVGIDFIPHVSDWSDFLIEDPQLFRWIKLNKNKTDVEIGLKDVDLTDEKDSNLKLNNNKTIQKELKDSMLKVIDGIDRNSDIKKELENNKISVKEAYKKLKKDHPDIKDKILWDLKIEKGYQIIPVAHSNKNLSKFSRWENGHAEFDASGGKVLGNLTSFKLYNNSKENNNAIDPSSPNEENIKYFKKILPELRKRLNFDFFRYDMGHHSIDSYNKMKPFKDSSVKLGYASLDNIKNLIKEIRDPKEGGNKAIGVLAECFSENGEPEFTDRVEKYFQNIGVNLTTGNDQYDKMTDKVKLIQKQNGVTKKIKEWGSFSNSKENNISRMFCIDTHDCSNGHHRLEVNNYSDIKSLLSIGLFGSAGLSRRPLYSIFGNEDGTIYETKDGEDPTVHPGKISPRNDENFNRYYHRLFNAYDSLKSIFTNRGAECELSLKKADCECVNPTETILESKVKSSSGNALVLTNLNSNMRAIICDYEIPEDLKTNNDLIILDDKTVDVKAGEIRKFARKIGQKMYINLPPGESHVFKVESANQNHEWLKVCLSEIVRDGRDVGFIKTIKSEDLMNAQFIELFDAVSRAKNSLGKNILKEIALKDSVAASVAITSEDKVFAIMKNLNAKNINLNLNGKDEEIEANELILLQLGMKDDFGF